MTNFIEVGKTYTDRTGVERECILVEDDLAWLRRGKKSPAYVWLRDGRAVNLSCSYDIDPPDEEKMQDALGRAAEVGAVRGDG